MAKDGPIDKEGSTPEKMDLGPSDENLEWVNQHYTSREVEKCGPKANDWKPKSKVGTRRRFHAPLLGDKVDPNEAYRQGWDAINWSKKSS